MAGVYDVQLGDNKVSNFTSAYARDLSPEMIDANTVRAGGYRVIVAIDEYLMDGVPDASIQQLIAKSLRRQFSDGADATTVRNALKSEFDGHEFVMWDGAPLNSTSTFKDETISIVMRDDTIFVVPNSRALQYAAKLGS